MMDATYCIGYVYDFVSILVRLLRGFTFSSQSTVWVYPRCTYLACWLVSNVLLPHKRFPFVPLFGRKATPNAATTYDLKYWFELDIIMNYTIMEDIPRPTAAPTAVGEPTNNTAILPILALVAVLLVITLFSIVPMRRNSTQVANQSDEEEEAADPEALKKRNHLIEESLTPKEVVGHKKCSNFSCDERRTPVLDCQICMEEFKVGERVALSMNCDHVYHFECIRRWLLKKEDCPYCRQSMLTMESSTKKKHVIESTSFYCIKHGLQRECNSGDEVDDMMMLDVESQRQVCEHKDHLKNAPQTNGTVVAKTVVDLVT